MISKPLKVLVIGHTGFVGSWMSTYLHILGFEVTGVSKANYLYSAFTPKQEIFQNEFLGDIRDFNFINEIISQVSPYYILNFAAQPLVLESYYSTFDTFQDNAVGTLNICESVYRNLDDCVLFCTTTDKVYKNNNKQISFNEIAELSGDDPYSLSKIAQESILKSYRTKLKLEESKIKLIWGRAGNIVGGGDYLESRLLPDLVRVINNDKNEITIRNGESVRPWQHVLDVIDGYWSFIKYSVESDDTEVMNFGPSTNVTVRDILNCFLESWQILGNKIDNLSIRFEDNPRISEKSVIKLDSSLAENKLFWKNKFSTERSVHLTAEWWHQVLVDKKDPYVVTKNQILENLTKISS